MWTIEGQQDRVLVSQVVVQGPPGTPLTGIVEDATAAHTLTMSDPQKLLKMTSNDPNAVIVPPHSAVPIAVTTQIGVWWAGDGETSIVAGIGVTILYRFTLKLGGKNAVATLIKVADNIWLLVGDTADV